MLRKGIVFTIFILNICIAYGQHKFVIKDTQSNKKRIFKPGNSFLFTTVSDSVFNKGVIEAISENALTISFPEDDTLEATSIPIQNFRTIRKATRLQYVTYAIGAVFMLNGAYFVLEGPPIIDNQWQSRGLGVISFAAGLIPFLITPKTYELGTQYQAEIIMEE